MASRGNLTLFTEQQANHTSPKSIFSDPLILVFCMYKIMVIVLSVTGYALIAFAMLLNSRLRSICNYFILSMGLADGLIATVVVPVSLGTMLRTLKYHSVGACEFVSNINLISIIAVAFNLCAVSLERFFVIQFPFGYEAFLTQKKASAIILAIWSYAIIAGLLPQMGWHDRDTVILPHGSCARPLSNDFLVFSTVTHFCIPAVIMIVSNALVYRVATKQAQRIFKITVQSRANSPMVPEYRNQPVTEVFRMNYRAAKRVSIIVGAYLFCWLPQMIVLLVGLKTGYTNIPPLVYMITIGLQYTSSAVNPCIFCFMNRELRMTIKREFRSRFPLCKRLLRLPNDPNVGSEFMSTPRDDYSFGGIKMSARSSQSTTVGGELFNGPHRV